MRIHRGMLCLVLSMAVSMCVDITTANAQTFKIAHWNMKSGEGKDGFSTGANIFNGADTTCTTNAWGVGYFQQFLNTYVKNDPDVVALVANEAWGNSCATPKDNLVGLVLPTWHYPRNTGTSTGEHDGVTILARYGFVGNDTGPSYQVVIAANPPNQEERILMHAQVYVDSTHTTFIDVFETHLDNSASERSTVVSYMAPLRSANTPHVIFGDLNAAVNVQGTCASLSEINAFTQSQYHDTWAEKNPQSPGYTAKPNTNGCGSPNGSSYKRIDYGLYWGGLTALSASLFGNVTAGDDAPSDHYGLVFEYSFGSGGDTTKPVVNITNPGTNQVVSGSVNVSVDATDNVGVTRVDLLRDGTVIHSWTSGSSPYTFTWDSTTVGNGTHTLQAIAYDAAGNNNQSTVTVDVENSTGAFWTALVNATATGTTIQKTGGCGTCLDAGGISMNTIASGDGYVQFVPSTATRLYAGLSSDRTNSTDVTQIKFAFSFWTGSTWDIRENNVYKTEGTYAAGDVFKIAIEAGVVKYYQNGILVYTSATPPSYPLGLDVSLMTINATVSNPVIFSSGGGGPTTSDIMWINAVNVAVTGNAIQKNAGCDGCPDAGAVSQQTIDAGDGSVDFVPSFGYRLYAGLGTDRSASTDRALINFAFSFWQDFTWDIREGDIYKTGGSYVSGDVFKIAVASGVVKYYKNGVLVYTSATPPSYPLGLDTTILSVSGNVTQAHITK